MAYPPLHLYYSPASAHSQKVLLALEEKQLKWSGIFVNIAVGEQNKPWYLRLNPEGVVPVLKVGDRVVTQGENIIGVIDGLSGGAQLAPDMSTTEGKLVEKWRSRLADFNFFVITYGLLVNPSQREGEMLIPSTLIPAKEAYQKKNATTIQKLEALKSKNPDLVDAINEKIARQATFSTEFLNEKKVEACKEELESFFDDIEAQLRTSRKENIAEHWLCGPTFTRADVTLCVALGRLRILGLIDRYARADRRPALVEYWRQARLRPSVQKVVLGALETFAMMVLRSKAKRVVMGSAVALGVVALGLVIGHKARIF